MRRRYPRLGEAIRAVCWTALLAGLLSALLASMAPGRAAWSLLWAGLVLACASFYLGDHRGWRLRNTFALQTGLVALGLISTLLVAGTHWFYPLIALVAAGLLIAVILISDDTSPGADLGGPVD